MLNSLSESTLRPVWPWKEKGGKGHTQRDAIHDIFERGKTLGTEVRAMVSRARKREGLTTKARGTFMDIINMFYLTYWLYFFECILKGGMTVSHDKMLLGNVHIILTIA